MSITLGCLPSRGTVLQSTRFDTHVRQEQKNWVECEMSIVTVYSYSLHSEPLSSQNTHTPCFTWLMPGPVTISCFGNAPSSSSPRVPSVFSNAALCNGTWKCVCVCVWGGLFISLPIVSRFVGNCRRYTSTKKTPRSKRSRQLPRQIDWDF